MSAHVVIGMLDAPYGARVVNAVRRMSYPAFQMMVLEHGVAALEHADGADARLTFAAGTSEAAALNAALEVMDWRARYVAVLRASFAPEPGFLRLAADHLEREGVSFVQFPQPFAGDGVTAQALDLERDELSPRRPSRAILQMNAASVISIDALREVGAWRESALAPEADLGARFLAAGLKGVFVNAPVGARLRRPYLAGELAERARHVQGASQTLRRDWRVFAGSTAPAPVAHLLNGHGFWLVPAAALAALGLILWAEPPTPAARAAELIAAWTILLTALAHALRVLVRGIIRRRRKRVLAYAVLVRIMMLWMGSTAWIDRRRRIERGPPEFQGALGAALGGLAAVSALTDGRVVAFVASCVVLVGVAGRAALERTLAREALEA